MVRRQANAGSLARSSSSEEVITRVSIFLQQNAISEPFHIWACWFLTDCMLYIHPYFNNLTIIVSKQVVPHYFFRYEILQNACIWHQIGVLMTAHHADDQVFVIIGLHWIFVFYVSKKLALIRWLAV